MQEVSARRHGGGHRRGSWQSQHGGTVLQPIPAPSSDEPSSLQVAAPGEQLPSLPPVDPPPVPTLDPSYPAPTPSPVPVPGLPDETGFGNQWAQQDPNTLRLPASEQPHEASAAFVSVASMDETSEPTPVPRPTPISRDTEESAADDTSNPLPRPPPLNRQAAVSQLTASIDADSSSDAPADDTSNPAPRPPPLNRRQVRHNKKQDDAAPAPSPRLHAIRPPHWHKPKWPTHPVGPELPPKSDSDATSTNAENDMPVYGDMYTNKQAGEQQQQQHDVSSLFGRVLHRLRHLANRIRNRHHSAESQLPEPEQPQSVMPLSSPSFIAVRMVALDPVPGDSLPEGSPLPAPAEDPVPAEDPLPFWDPVPEDPSMPPVPAVDPAPEPEPDNKRHHGGHGRHHGGHGAGGNGDAGENSGDKDADKKAADAAAAAAKVAAKHDKHLRKAFLKLRKAVESPADLLRLRLELHRFESQMGLASELQNADVLPAVPAYGGMPITDDSYKPIDNDATWNNQLEDGEDSDSKQSKHHGHHSWRGASRKHMVMVAAGCASLGLLTILLAVCCVMKRRRAHKRMIRGQMASQQQMQNNSILPSYAPNAPPQPQQSQPQQQQQYSNVPVAEPVYPQFAPHYNYVQLANVPPASVRVQ